MKLLKEELNMFHPNGNRVLVRSIISMDSIMLGREKIYIDTTYKPEYHQNVICEVVATPHHLTFDRKKPVGISMEWNTEMDLKKGDIVWCNYLAVIRSKEDLVIECDGIGYFLVDYQRIYLKKCKSDVTMLNGWVLCEPVYMTPEEKVVGSHRLYLPKIKTADQLEGTAKDTFYGRVKHIGKPVREYYSIESPPDDDFLRVGDMVQFVSPHNVRLEHELHRHFDGTDLIVSRRNRMVGIVEF